MAGGPRNDDQRRLREAFYRAFDRSKAEHWLARPAGLELVGEGAHFAAWRLPARSGGLGLVLKRALSPGALASGPNRRAWLAALRQAVSLDLALVPPLEVLESGDDLGLVMPYGPAPLTSAAPHWLPLASHLADLHAGLAAVGLELADHPQGRTWEGVPFIYDWSDLRRR